MRFLACRCGRDLRELPVRPLSPEARRHLIDEPVPLAVLQWLGSLARHGLGMKPLKKAYRLTQVNVIDLAEAGACIVAGWPGAFFRMLDDCRQDPTQRGGPCLLNNALPGLAKRVRRIRDAAWQARIAAALGTYSSSSLQTTSPIIGRNVPDARPPTVSGIARQLGIRTERLVAELERLPEASIGTRRTASGRQRRVLGAATIEDVRQRINDEVSVKQAANLLGLPAARVLQLIDEELLPTKGRRLSRASVDRLRQSLIAAGHGTPRPVEAITLGRALRYLVPVRLTTCFAKAILEGSLVCHALPDAQLPGQLLVSADAVKAWTSNRSGAGREWLSIPECAERLGVKQEVAYHFARVGLLVAHRIVANGRSMQVVTASAIRAFEVGIEPLARLAARVGLDHRRALAWAKASGLELVSGPTVDGGRQYFARIT